MTSVYKGEVKFDTKYIDDWGKINPVYDNWSYWTYEYTITIKSLTFECESWIQAGQGSLSKQYDMETKISKEGGLKIKSIVYKNFPRIHMSTPLQCKFDTQYTIEIFTDGGSFFPKLAQLNWDEQNYTLTLSDNHGLRYTTQLKKGGKSRRKRKVRRNKKTARRR